MFLSIIIPVYNTEKYLSECLDSIINQEFKDYEIILVDDGSTDSSAAICDEYVNKYSFIRCVHRKENKRQLFSRLEGIDLAVGEYCWFIDSDDYVTSNSLQCISEKLKDKTIDILFFNMLVYENGKIKKIKAKTDSEICFENDKSFIYKKIASTDELNSMCCRVVKTELLKEDNTDYSIYFPYLHGEDAVQSLYSVTYAKKIVFINEYLYVYRANDSSVTKRKRYLNEINWRYNKCYYDMLLDYLDKWEINSVNYRKVIYKRSYLMLQTFYITIFESCSTKKERKGCIEYDWMSLLPNRVLKEYKFDNLSLKNKFIYWCMKNKSYFSLRIYNFFRKLKKICNVFSV